VPINKVFEAALELQRFCELRQYRFCVIGAVALQRWGDPRATQDVDLTLLTGFGSEERFISELTEHFRPRRHDSAEFALKTRVLLLFASNDVPIDIALGGLPFEARTIERSSLWQIESEMKITTCSAEDLVVHKAFANREQDWADIERVLMRQIKRLNIDLILKELRPLLELKEAPEIEDRLRKMMEKEKLEN
jgi:predicted nucleotidyltransferase